MFSSESPQKKDLQVSHDGFEKREGRIFYLLMSSSWFRVLQVLKWFQSCSSNLEWVNEWMEGSLILNWARISKFQLSPLKNTCLVQLVVARIPVDYGSNVAQWWRLMMNRARTNQILEEIWEKFWKKLREFFEMKNLDLKKWIVIMDSVMIMLYILLINNA